ncbi:hypothetical protein ASPZODRAFT_130216 [Penicilliopsis zonata CBS 506.65]|uniref:AB hydrolase-1 domain-containing protein n=1 Tax=Penicilliopsis zonata CBS 506.65 TaxID=1073090 RepID=A0A1L9SMJ7_9EURO|nr:hypothetical protein ASPZODRAFT_130216 [Penicilliopsis zonata CBS 506.65]OJJ48257.1 hypothetical protein ASPZODRAFT_130216 [Penicilliopsis zonata CBS 506.65]
MKPTISSEVFFSNSTTDTSVFFIPGNPGLVEYYHLFLSLLSSQLQDACSIYGCSLGGFIERTRLYSLEEQIGYVEGCLEKFIASRGAKKTKVILIGHSVGSYIAMEIIRRHHEKNTAEKNNNDISFEIIGGTMLFPTVMEIADSPSGRKLTSLLFIPKLPSLANFLSRVLTSLLPAPLLRWTVQRVTGMPEPALQTTLSFLRSRQGVEQALYMAADEMKTITTDKWTDEIWGIQGPIELFFYFGRDDHWVAEETREKIMQSRGRHDDGPTMVVCEEGLPHAFCISRSFSSFFLSSFLYKLSIRE